jgi:CBS domain-containing protein
MRVADLMTRSVLCVDETTPVRRIAQLLVEHGISAVPVVRDGEPVGIVSESDLVARDPVKGLSRRNWLELLLTGGGLAEQVDTGRLASDVMTTPIITINEAADIADAVKLMVAHNIKRLPVVRASRISGIISRADLLRGFGHLAVKPEGPDPDAENPFIQLDRAHDINLDQPSLHNGMAAAGEAADEPILSASDFHHSVELAKAKAAALAAEERRQAGERHAHEIEVTRNEHVSEDEWRHLLLDARRAAEHGATEIQVLRFPREICSDGGRMINVAEPGWQTSLRGKAAEIWHRWHRELKPRGFRMVARTLEYPGGLPGDIGLFLVWG